MSDTGVFTVDLATDAEQLRQSMQARPNPDVAKGVLMVLYGCNELQAFAELVRVSEQEQVLLVDLAAALVYLVREDAPESPDSIDPDDSIEADPEALAAARREWGDALGRVRGSTGPGLLYPWPRSAHRLAEAAEYLGELLSPRSLVSLGLVLRPRPAEDARS